jgi:hypothetical protein
VFIDGVSQGTTATDQNGANNVFLTAPNGLGPHAVYFSGVSGDLAGAPLYVTAACNTYVTTTSTGSIVPGTTDTGNHCDDCATQITFPFPVTMYGQSFTTANVASNGSLDLMGTQAPFTHGCLALPSASWNMAILPYQDDLRTDNISFT